MIVYYCTDAKRFVNWKSNLLDWNSGYKIIHLKKPEIQFVIRNISFNQTFKTEIVKNSKTTVNQ